MSVINEEELREIVEVVWMTALELPIGDGVAFEPSPSEYKVSQISISGAWEGFVTVRASVQFLTQAAGRMFSCSVDEVSDPDRGDALTELTNMLGGTVKCLLPETCDLSLPSILDEDKPELDWVYFSCNDTLLAVAVTQGTDSIRQAA